jgi:hypothetical protein
MKSPTDALTRAARSIVVAVTSILAWLLSPVDKAMRLIGRVLLFIPFIFVIAFFMLMILDMIWLPIWGMLVGSSWLWLKYPAARPFLILPGMVLAVAALIYIMLAPEPHKNPGYTTMPQEWPLSWLLWSPPPEYFEERPKA